MKPCIYCGKHKRREEFTLAINFCDDCMDRMWVETNWLKFEDEEYKDYRYIQLKLDDIEINCNLKTMEFKISDSLNSYKIPREVARELFKLRKV